MAFQVPAHKQSRGQNMFTFGPKTGVEFKVQKASLRTVGQLEEMDQGNNAVKFFSGDTAEQAKYIRSLHREQFQELVKAWNADSGVTAGE